MTIWIRAYTVPNPNTHASVSGQIPAHPRLQKQIQRKKVPSFDNLIMSQADESTERLL